MKHKILNKYSCKNVSKTRSLTAQLDGLSEEMLFLKGILLQLINEHVLLKCSLKKTLSRLNYNER